MSVEARPIIANLARLHDFMDRHRLAAVVARLLEEGMVLAIEPQGDYWHLQDLVLVRDVGPQLISDRFSTDQMFVVE